MPTVILSKAKNLYMDMLIILEILRLRALRRSAQDDREEACFNGYSYCAFW